MRPAAVFDLDGTLIRGTSAERLLVPWLVRGGVIGWRQLASAAGLAAGLPVLGRTRALRRNKRWLAGVPAEAVEARLEAFLDEVVAPRWCQATVARLEALRGEGVAPFLLTGAPDFLARVVGRRLGMEGWRGTRLETRSGRYTGRLSGTHWFGPAKAEALDALAREHGLDLEASWGFADHLTDVPFLERFGRPVVVDPGPELGGVARERGWEVLACGSGEGRDGR